jgi:hypothetical protein
VPTVGEQWQLLAWNHLLVEIVIVAALNCLNLNRGSKQQFPESIRHE